jgi:ribonuclease HII
MERALKNLKERPSIAYIDGIFIPKNTSIKCKAFIKGDEKIACISAASIIAKVSRDLFMIKLSKKYPKYKWDKNFGYGTYAHLHGLKKHGITKHHRKKFKPIYNMLVSASHETL